MLGAILGGGDTKVNETQTLAFKIFKSGGGSRSENIQL